MNIRFSTCKFLGLLLAAGLVSGQAMAQNEDSARASASATILTPISIAKNEDMLFGNVVTSSEAGTVVLATDGQREGSPNTTLTGTNGTGTVRAAKFTVTGDSDTMFSYEMPETITLNAGTNSMTVDTIKINAGTAETGNSGTSRLESGEQTLLIGGTLNVGANQVAGEYSGTFDVTVAYN
jgi:hypothetical protein